MMQWTRAKIEETCGMCGQRIYAQQPMLLISRDGLKRKLHRCGDCAGPVPPDLPAEIETRDSPSRMKPLRVGAPSFLNPAERDRYGESR